MQPGSRLGPYEMIDPIGAGGMGEVHRGRDTRLGRDVAIKVLPAESASGPLRSGTSPMELVPIMWSISAGVASPAVRRAQRGYEGLGWTRAWKRA
jgi:serine/threonine protein kinase